MVPMAGAPPMRHTPSARRGHSAISLFLANHHLMVVFGGAGPNAKHRDVSFNETWCVQNDSAAHRAAHTQYRVQPNKPVPGTLTSPRGCGTGPT